ncbi:hypothetical protein PHYSODRAFT_303518 [Phytophthora sojae]|uniref:Uncharacterized protein n=1 Tax=Phytophthora sojae (strain P6497) TaxID=1094619 RepID=G4ZS67_PHYSP|nr:hypothetical protein PHYSODRAFT_303518 [Phytophthora sojae]EGZ14363.1 hypothetical protein PHYSODRAFT_303518 [Phytophthora sojae]|eukprot:XP_009531792.1 hypothetical protein PHYSODRAFT_303518 [Phytophthora sojae]
MRHFWNQYKSKTEDNLIVRKRMLDDIAAYYSEFSECMKIASYISANDAENPYSDSLTIDRNSQYRKCVGSKVSIDEVIDKAYEAYESDKYDIVDEVDDENMVDEMESDTLSQTELEVLFSIANSNVVNEGEYLRVIRARVLILLVSVFEYVVDTEALLLLDIYYEFQIRNLNSVSSLTINNNSTCLFKKWGANNRSTLTMDAEFQELLGFNEEEDFLADSATLEKHLPGWNDKVKAPKLVTTNLPNRQFMKATASLFLMGGDLSDDNIAYEETLNVDNRNLASNYKSFAVPRFYDNIYDAPVLTTACRDSKNKNYYLFVEHNGKSGNSKTWDRCMSKLRKDQWIRNDNNIHKTICEIWISVRNEIDRVQPLQFYNFLAFKACTEAVNNGSVYHQEQFTKLESGAFRPTLFALMCDNALVEMRVFMPFDQVAKYDTEIGKVRKSWKGFIASEYTTISTNAINIMSLVHGVSIEDYVSLKVVKRSYGGKRDWKICFCGVVVETDKDYIDSILDKRLKQKGWDAPSLWLDNVMFRDREVIRKLGTKLFASNASCMRPVCEYHPIIRTKLMSQIMDRKEDVQNMTIPEAPLVTMFVNNKFTYADALVFSSKFTNSVIVDRRYNVMGYDADLDITIDPHVQFPMTSLVNRETKEQLHEAFRAMEIVGRDVVNFTPKDHKYERESRLPKREFSCYVKVPGYETSSGKVIHVLLCFFPVELRRWESVLNQIDPSRTRRLGGSCLDCKSEKSALENEYGTLTRNGDRDILSSEMDTEEERKSDSSDSDAEHEDIKTWTHIDEENGNKQFLVNKKYVILYRALMSWRAKDFMKMKEYADEKGIVLTKCYYGICQYYPLAHLVENKQQLVSEPVTEGRPPNRKMGSGPKDGEMSIITQASVRSFEMIRQHCVESGMVVVSKCPKCRLLTVMCICKVKPKDYILMNLRADFVRWMLQDFPFTVASQNATNEMSNSTGDEDTDSHSSKHPTNRSLEEYIEKTKFSNCTPDSLAHAIEFYT